jgi:hypothetical protein
MKWRTEVAKESLRSSNRPAGAALSSSTSWPLKYILQNC